MVLDYFNNLVPSHRKLAVEMVGLVWLQSMKPDNYLDSFVGGRVASLGELAKLRPTFEVHNFCRVPVIEWYSDCPKHASMNLVATETITLANTPP